MSRLLRITTLALAAAALVVPASPAARPNDPAPPAADRERPDRPPRPDKPKKTKTPETDAEEIEALADLPTVDARLAEVAVEVVDDDAEATLRVVVFGDGVASTVGGDADVRRSLGDDAASVRVPVTALYELATRTGVTFVALDVPVRPASASTSLQPTASFAAADQAPYAWGRGATGRGVGVAVIDSGVSATAAFGGRLVHVDLGDGARPDTFGHGTFVAAIAGASLAGEELSGIAPGARVFDVNVSQDDGVYTSDVIAGLEWVRENHRDLGIRVVNLSLTETMPSSHTRSPLDAAVERLWHAGVVVVVAAGNNGPGTAVHAPANDPYVITVGAVDQGMRVDSSDDVPAAFSATGPTLDGVAKPDLLAPGRRVVSILPPLSSLVAQAPEANVLGGGRYTMTGTSFSAPQVAGAAAVLLARNPRWTPAQVKWLLTRTARGVPGSRAGALDLRRALTFAGRPRSANRDLPGAAAERLRPDALFAPDAWAGNSWSGNTWSGNTWSGNTWSGNTWSGNTWTGNTWVGLADPFAP